MGMSLSLYTEDVLVKQPSIGLMEGDGITIPEEIEA